MLDSFRENIDYDVIKLHTVTTDRSPNVRLDLSTNDLLVYGITSQIEGVDGAAISLSDRKRVVIVPDFARVTFKKNKDFEFSGGILAGMFEFFTKDSHFNYEHFTIDMEMKKASSIWMVMPSMTPSLPTNPFGPSVQARPLRPSKPKRCMPISAR